MAIPVNEPVINGDLIGTLAGLAPDGAVAALRAARADVTRFTQGSHDALFDRNATGLSLEERLAAASYAAHVAAAPDVARAYRERLHAVRSAAGDETSALLERLVASGDALGGQAASASFDAGDNPRINAILSHTHALARLEPPPGKPALARLRQAGLATREVVALSQLVAFVSYQVRVIAGLRALEATA
jgi:CMD domain protein